MVFGARSSDGDGSSELIEIPFTFKLQCRLEYTLFTGIELLQSVRLAEVQYEYSNKKSCRLKE